MYDSNKELKFACSSPWLKYWLSILPNIIFLSTGTAGRITSTFTGATRWRVRVTSLASTSTTFTGTSAPPSGSKNGTSRGKRVSSPPKSKRYGETLKRLENLSRDVIWTRRKGQQNNVVVSSLTSRCRSFVLLRLFSWICNLSFPVCSIINDIDNTSVVIIWYLMEIKKLSVSYCDLKIGPRLFLI